MPQGEIMCLILSPFTLVICKGIFLLPPADISQGSLMFYPSSF